MSDTLGSLTDIYYKSYIGSTKIDTLLDDNIDIYDNESERKKKPEDE
jgi:hypothetical protein